VGGGRSLTITFGNSNSVDGGEFALPVGKGMQEMKIYRREEVGQILKGGEPSRAYRRGLEWGGPGKEGGGKVFLIGERRRHYGQKISVPRKEEMF